MFQSYGILGCLWASVVFAAIAGAVSLLLPHKDTSPLMNELKAGAAD